MVEPPHPSSADSTSQQSSSVQPLVTAGQKIAGALAARDRGDLAGAKELLTSFESDAELAGGAILIAELAITLLHHATGEPVQDCLQALSLDLERAAR